MGSSESGASSYVLRIIALVAAFFAYKWVGATYDFPVIANIGIALGVTILLSVTIVFFTAILKPEKTQETEDN